MDRYKTIINRKNIIILVSILIVCAGMFLFRQVEDTGFTGLHDSRKALETYIDVYGGTDFAQHITWHWRTGRIIIRIRFCAWYVTSLNISADMRLMWTA